MDYTAILCAKEGYPVATKSFKSEAEFLDTMKDDVYRWGYLFHIKTGIMISSYHPLKD